MNEKQTGSFYTPMKLVEYMTRYALTKRNLTSKILEPSAGDGRFLGYLTNVDRDIDAIEVDMSKTDVIKKKFGDNKVNSVCSDFIEYALNERSKYDLIIGNPPYISKKNLPDKNRLLSLELVKYWDLPDSVFQNLWVSFVLGSLKLLNMNTGSIFFVLPFEFLQVHYAQKLRVFLESKFKLIEITTFRENVFPDIDQDVCLVYMTNNNQSEASVKYTTVNNIEEFKVIETSEIKRNNPLKKWSNSILTDEEIELLDALSSKYMKIDQIGDISPGIVTGANNFFIMNNDSAIDYDLIDSFIPIIQKGSHISNSIIFNKEDLNNLLLSGKPMWMLNLTGTDEAKFPNKLNEYISKGEKEEINKRYKCGNRKRWYDVPLIKSGDLMFFKRFNLLPKLVINEARVNTTDISYNIRLFKAFNAQSVAFCFYNSLTITLCEYNGRFYGGGVGELVPSEFKSLSLPYMKIDKRKVKKLDRMIRNNSSIREIISYVDSVVLKELSLNEIEMLERIRSKFLMRRLKQYS